MARAAAARVGIAWLIAGMAVLLMLSPKRRCTVARTISPAAAKPFMVVPAPIGHDVAARQRNGDSVQFDRILATAHPRIGRRVGELVAVKHREIVVVLAEIFFGVLDAAKTVGEGVAQAEVVARLVGQAAEAHVRAPQAGHDDELGMAAGIAAAGGPFLLVAVAKEDDHAVRVPAANSAAA